MTNTGKIQAIWSVLLLNDPDKRRYIKLLEDLGDLKTNYGDYMIIYLPWKNTKTDYSMSVEWIRRRILYESGKNCFT